MVIGTKALFLYDICMSELTKIIKQNLKWIIPLSLLLVACGSIDGTSEATEMPPPSNDNPTPVSPGTPATVPTVTPAPVDLDNDGILDHFDPNPNENSLFSPAEVESLPQFGLTDTDGDGLVDGLEEYIIDQFGVNLNIDSIDSNGNGITDLHEVIRMAYRTGPLVIPYEEEGNLEKLSDSDGDGLTDPYELNVLHSDINNVDTDHDGIADGWDSNPVVPVIYPRVPLGYEDQVHVDTDHDGITDAVEEHLGSDPALVLSTQTFLSSMYGYDYADRNAVSVYNVGGVEIRGVEYLSDFAKHQLEVNSDSFDTSYFKRGRMIVDPTVSYNCHYYVLSRHYPEVFNGNESWINEEVDDVLERHFDNIDNIVVGGGKDLDVGFDLQNEDIIIFRAFDGTPVHSVYTDFAGEDNEPPVYTSKIGHNGLYQNDDLDEYLEAYGGISHVELYRRK